MYRSARWLGREKHCPADRDSSRSRSRTYCDPISFAPTRHAALLESQVAEAIDTNVIGTLNVCEAALGTGTKRLVFISTDKAVNAEGVMGATKRLGELLIRSLSQDSETVFSVVRFGNVLG